MERLIVLSYAKILFIALLSGLLVACGGGSSSDPAEQQFGGMTILIGDGPLDEVDQVNINIGRMLLIGGDGGQVLLTDQAMLPSDELNLLELRNLTKLLLDVDGIPAGNYTKVRLYINRLEIVEGSNMQDAQLPANGKIDLLAQGGFEISPGEDLVIEIDVDLERSVHVVATGNSEYRFRPVVFIEEVDIRLSQLFGTVVGDESMEGNFNLCLAETCTCEADDGNCVSVVSNGAPRLPVLGETDETLSNGNPVHVFGIFDVGRTTTEEETVFNAVVVVKGNEDSVAKIDGVVALDGTGGIESIDGITIDPVTDIPPLDRQANEITPADGDDAESWAQVDPMAELPDPFPSFLTLVTPADDEEALEGELVSLEGDLLTLQTEELDQVCVIVDDATEIQLVEGFDNDASTGLMALTDLLALDPQLETIEVAAFGTFDGDCLNADVVVIETD